MRKVDVTLYLVTDGTGIGEEAFLEKIALACDGGVTMVQLREKEKSGIEIFRLAEKVKKITDSKKIPLIIDDRADIALAVDADGVHVGRSDLPVWATRKLLGDKKIVGATAKTVEQAKKAEAEGADYLGVGAIFPTTTKVVTVITKVETLDEISKSVKIPVAAIGGLNEGNLDVLFESGADGIAVVSALMKSEKPDETAKKLRILIEQNFKKFKEKTNGRV